MTKKTAITKNGRRPRPFPKGRPLEEAALEEVRELLEGKMVRRDLLIEHLHLLQDRFGHLAARHLRALAEILGLSQAEVWEVASFYAHFDLVKEGETPPPTLTIRVCDSLPCRMRGAEALAEALAATLDPGKVRVLRAPCMGRCDRAPAVMLGKRDLSGRNVAQLAAEARAAAADPARTRQAPPPAERLAAARARGAYRWRDRPPAAGEVLAALETAGLRGMGGAGFPTHAKWRIVRENVARAGEGHVVVNADEGEPGTFKDRHLLETAPHRVLEGALIAAEVVGARTVWIYLRDEYPALHALLAEEIAALEEAGLAAPGRIVLRRGAGAYICGEESALIESLEGRRGLPRHRPPYVAEKGLFGKPTLVNNVETLWWAGRIVTEGPEIFAVEHNGRRGLRHYSVSGRVKRPGVHLLPAGATIGEVIAAAGGMEEGHRFAAWVPGGASSGILPATLDDVPLDFGCLEPHGAFIGSAAVMVLSDRDDIADAARGFLAFFAHESCGQCTPCRAGCAKALQLMEGPWDAERLGRLGALMRDASICGLGQAAPNAFETVLRHFPDAARES